MKGYLLTLGTRTNRISKIRPAAGRSAHRDADELER